MSKDIRSFFKSKIVPKPKLEELDDDVIPESPEVQIKKKESRKKRVLSDDSDDEILPSSKKKVNNEPKKATKSLNKSKSPKKANLKEVKAADIFGSSCIKRSKPLVVNTKKVTEVGIHSDDEFDNSLLELDEAAVSESVIKTNGDGNIRKSTLNNTDTKDTTTTKANHDKISQKNPGSKNLSNKRSFDETMGNENKSDNQKECIDNNTTKNTTTTKLNHDKISHENPASKSMSNKRSFDETIGNENKSDNQMESIDNNSTKDTTTTKVNHDKISHKNSGSKSLSSKRSFDETIANENKTDNQIESIDNNSTNDVDSTKKWQKKKDNFSEFINSSTSEDHDDHGSKNKKRKLNKSLNDSVLTDEERHERKMHSSILYQQYQNRAGPKNLGSKEIPEGAKDCLKDCAFLLTGVLDSFERDEVANAITKYGGSVKNSISKKVTHVLAGEDSGPAKMAKARELGIKIINEDEFIQMIANTSRNQKDKSSKDNSTNVKHDIKHDSNKESKKEKNHKRKSSKEKNIEKGKEVCKIKVERDKESPKKEGKLNNSVEAKRHRSNDSDNKSSLFKNNNVKDSERDSDSKKTEIMPNKQNESLKNPEKSENVTSVNQMLVEKYKPQTVKQIIGQHGDASNVKKLSNWLTKWYINRKAKLTKPSPWAKNDDGGFFKAALLSGPPGVGKTTTVGLVCKELGFDMVEFNASDTRNKTLIKEQIGEMLTTTSLSAYAKGESGKQAVTKKHVLVMDEVDGMAGNEDRGGLQELIGLIKSTSVPIICMCNDRFSQKMKSLLNYVYELKFSRPRLDQIKSAMMSICFKEGLKVPADVLTQLITAANRDVRQTLNLLSMWTAGPAPTVVNAKVKTDLKLGPWEAVHKVFTKEEHKLMSINEKSDLFFYDYSLAPLFVQENYLSVEPHCPKNEVLDRLRKTADSISMGDLVEARIRRSQAWGLLPVQAMYSSVIPGHQMSGHVTKFIQFPGWLGKNSRSNKMQRLCQEIHAHTRLSTSGSKSSIFLDYCTHLRDAVVNPLIKEKSEGIPKSIEVLESYHLLREDLDSLVELSLWPAQRNPMILVDSTVKAAMTRAYNKNASALPYAPGAAKRGRGQHVDADEEGDADADEDEEQGNDSDLESDALIKKKKTKEPGKQPSTEKSKANKEKSKAKNEKGKKK